MNRNITALILIVLAIGIYFTVTEKIYAGAKEVQAVNSQYSSAIASADKLIKTRDQVLKSYNSLSQDDRTRLDKMIPSTVDNIRLIIDLNSVALRHNFSLKNIRAVASNAPKAGASAPAPATAPGGIAIPTLDTVTISFSVSAPYNEFISFLQDLEANLRIMDVTHLTVSANDTNTYDFGVEMRTYWLRQ